MKNSEYLNEHDYARASNDELMELLRGHRGGLSMLECEILNRMFTAIMSLVNVRRIND